MKVVVINGKGGCGKDTFVSMCYKLLNQNQTKCCLCYNLSTVDLVKEAAAVCGWAGEKDPASRKFLSQLKDILTEWKDLPFQDVVERTLRIQHKTEISGCVDDAIVFIHCREPHEIQRLVDELGARSLLIRRAAAESVEQCNHADNGVLDYEYDFTIDNNGTLDQLKEKAKAFLSVIFAD